VGKKINSLHIEKKNQNKSSDPCPLCGYNLFYNSKFSKRIVLFDKQKTYVADGWMCPECESEFDLKDNLTYINTSKFTHGKA
jgi:DNA-directed RNA polymerase subunit RPC12/RpoP